MTLSKACFKHFCLFLTLCFSTLFADATTPVRLPQTKIRTIKHSTRAAQHDQAALDKLLQELGVSPLFDYLKKNVSGLSKLSYHTAKDISLPLVAGQKLIFDWGFAGSGELFDQLPELEIKVSDPVYKKSADSLWGVATDWFRSYACKKAKFRADPKLTFLFKLFLLCKDGVSDVALVREELFRLLFKLSMTPSTHLFDGNTVLSEYLPEELVQFFNNNSPDLLQNIDGAWALVTNLSLESVEKYTCDKESVEMDVFVMRDLAQAQSCAEYLANGSEITFEDKMAEALATHGVKQHDIIDYEKFKQYLLKQSDAHLAQYVQKFVGKASFTLGDKNLPVRVKDKIEQLCQTNQLLPQVQLISVDSDQHWVLLVRGKLGLFRTTKMTFANMLRALADYANVKQKIAASDIAESLQDKQALEQAEQERIATIEFLRTEYGKASAQRIQQAVAGLLEKYKDQQEQASECSRVEQLKSCQKQLDDLAEIESDVDNQQDYDNQIKNLQTRIAGLELQLASALAIENNLNVRRELVWTYRCEKEEIDAQLAQEQMAIDAILDETERKTAQLKFAPLKKQYIHYMEQLEKRAQQLEQENECVKELVSVRSALRACSDPTDLPAEKIDRLEELERDVQLIQDGPEAYEVTFLTHTHKSELKQFVGDVMYNSAYGDIKYRLVGVFDYIFQKSSYVQENIDKIVVLITPFIPELLPYIMGEKR
ncbi:MAG: hypothetical protein H6679_00755 [Epsilonproteobacteria bacterium]|nr:hypothetical protein [Campylobacterota bacterium]